MGRKKKAIEPSFSTDIGIPSFSINLIEEATNYSLLARNYTHKGIHIGNREKLAKILLNVPVDMVVATTGTSDRCMILVDYDLGDLMDLIFRAKESN